MYINITTYCLFNFHRTFKSNIHIIFGLNGLFSNAHKNQEKKIDIFNIEKTFRNNSSQLDENNSKSQCRISALSTNPVQRQGFTIVQLIIQRIKYLGILT